MAISAHDTSFDISYMCPRCCPGRSPAPPPARRSVQQKTRFHHVAFVRIPNRCSSSPRPPSPWASSCASICAHGLVRCNHLSDLTTTAPPKSSCRHRRHKRLLMRTSALPDMCHSERVICAQRQNDSTHAALRQKPDAGSPPASVHEGAPAPAADLNRGDTIQSRTSSKSTSSPSSESTSLSSTLSSSLSSSSASVWAQQRERCRVCI